MQSDSLVNLAAALAKAQGAMENASKDTRNPFFNSKYADLASVWTACRKPLSDNGLSVVQLPDVKFEGAPEFESYKTRNGEERWRAKVLTTVSVRTRLLHESGEWLDDVIVAVLPSGDPQSIGSAITYLRRYALSALVGVAPEDDDGEATARPTNGTARSVAEAPAGYEDWVLSLEAAAVKGMKELTAAFNAAKEEQRRFLLSSNPQAWARMRTDAGKVAA